MVNQPGAIDAPNSMFYYNYLVIKLKAKKTAFHIRLYFRPAVILLRLGG